MIGRKRSTLFAMPRVSIDIDVIVTTALAVVDAEGPDALSLSSVARELGVGPSALYTHVDGLRGLHEAAAAAATRQLASRLRDAAIGRGGDDAIHAVAVAYRGYTVDHPGRLVSLLRVDAGEAIAEATAELDGVFALLGVARGLDRRDADRVGRHVRRAIHGFVVSERHGDTSPDDDYADFVTALCRMLDPQL